MAYTANPLPQATTVDQLRQFVEEEFKRLQTSLAETTAVELRPINAVPIRPREGMIVFADGTNWNPGGGKGVYTYSGGAWVKL